MDSFWIYYPTLLSSILPKLFNTGLGISLGGLVCHSPQFSGISGQVSVLSAMPRALRKSRAALTEKDQSSQFVPSNFETCWKALAVAESVILSFKTGRESRAEVVKECVVIWVSVKNSEHRTHNLLKQ